MGFLILLALGNHQIILNWKLSKRICWTGRISEIYFAFVLIQPRELRFISPNVICFRKLMNQFYGIHPTMIWYMHFILIHAIHPWCNNSAAHSHALESWHPTIIKLVKKLYFHKNWITISNFPSIWQSVVSNAVY